MQGCFLILNYKNSAITQEAVKYLKKLDGINECKIIIYDNGSDNGSLELLKKAFINDDIVVVGGSKVNLGFSEGNNAAYRLALRYCEHFDFVVAMNSDVMIHQKDFICRINRYVDEDEQAVIGPDVYNSPRKTHGNPLFMEIPSAKEVDEHIASHEYQLMHIGETASKLRKTEIKSRMGRMLPYWAIHMYRKIRIGNYQNNYEKKLHNPVLNGCCLIYLRKYLERETLLFEPDTFLYGEEILLSIKCKTKGYKVLYDPVLKIEHRESVSTKTDKTKEEYVKDRNEKLIHAYKMVKKCIEDNPWEEV